jgi:hypothetical protein
MPLHVTSWRLLVLCGVMIAHKAIEDNTYTAGAFAELYPLIRLPDLKMIERMFLELLQ